jgi:beta-glucosidase
MKITVKLGHLWSYTSLTCIGIGLCLSFAGGALIAQQPTVAATELKVQNLLTQMTLDQKLKLVGGNGMFTYAIPEIGLPAIKMSDGPSGVRSWGPSNAYPVGMALAATWDPAIANREGVALGQDAKARGVNILLAPGVNIYRAPMNGRNFEYLGEDPYLSARMAVGCIDGVQSAGVAATVKHFVANNSEFDRHNTNSIIDERTLREIYLPAFEAAVKEAHVSAVMDSYNLVNGEHMTQNGVMNNDILKHEWKYDGLLMSDWNATYDGVAAACGGLDLEMPRGKFMTPETLGAAIKAGTLSQAVVDDHVRRILRLAVRYNIQNNQPAGAPYSPSAKNIAYDVAAESIVLLKNEHNLLPLDTSKTHRIAVLGPNSYPGVIGGGGSSYTIAFGASNLYTSLADGAGSNAQVTFSPGISTESEICAKTKFPGGLDQEMYSGTAFAGDPQRSHVSNLNLWAPTFKIGGEVNEHAKSYRWTGHYTADAAGDYLFLVAAHGRDSFTFFIDNKNVLAHNSSEGASPKSFTAHLNAGQTIAVQLDYIQRSKDLTASLGIIAVDQLVLPEAKKIAAAADAVIVYVGFNESYESEAIDRSWDLLPGQNELVEAAIAANPRTIVILNGGGGMNISAWVDRVPALLHTFYGGEEGGHALADVLLGTINPSGKLPVSFERQLADDSTFDTYYPGTGTVDVPYAEGIFVGYRHFDRSAVKPIFPFGYGLSYTSFDFSHLTIDATDPSNVVVAFDLRNTGDRPGDEVAQLYVGEVAPPLPRPVKELKSFQRVHLGAGQGQHIVLQLPTRAFSYWDTTRHGWKRDNGQFRIYVGDSSVAVPLQQTISLQP